MLRELSNLSRVMGLISREAKIWAQVCLTLTSMFLTIVLHCAASGQAPSTAQFFPVCFCHLGLHTQKFLNLQGHTYFLFVRIRGRVSEEDKTFGFMSGAGNLAINILNELKRSQVSESKVLMARQQCGNEESEVLSKIMKSICEYQIMEGKQRLPGMSLVFEVN